MISQGKGKETCSTVRPTRLRLLQAESEAPSPLTLDVAGGETRHGWQVPPAPQVAHQIQGLLVTQKKKTHLALATPSAHRG